MNKCFLYAKKAAQVSHLQKFYSLQLSDNTKLQLQLLTGSSHILSEHNALVLSWINWETEGIFSCRSG